CWRVRRPIPYSRQLKIYRPTLLRRSGATVTLALNSLCAEQTAYVEQLLDALAPYGTRVSVWIDEHVRTRLAVDSSTFHLMLSEPLADPRP
ncbi:MAG: hypothetical protein P8180_11925, partial [Gammaproteobacteria bacterium]